MKRIHSQAVHVDNTAFALFGLSRTNLLYNMITQFYAEEIGENLVGTNELSKHSLDYRWQWAVMKAINFAVQSQGFDEWIKYLQSSYKYVKYVRDDFYMFVEYEKQVAFVAKFVKRMFSSNQKPKNDDPVLLLDSTMQLYNWIRDNMMSLMVQKKIGVVTNYTLDYTWQYALMLAMISLKSIYGESRNKKFWTDYLQKAYSQTAATPTAPVNAEPPAPASWNGGPNPPGDGGGPPSGEQSDSGTSGSDRPQSAREQRTVKETEGAQEARAIRLRGAVTERDNTREKKVKDLRKIGETGGGTENDAGQTTTSTPATSEPSTPRSGAAGGGAGGKLVEEKTPRSKPYTRKKESGNEAPVAQVEVPKLPLPAQREVSPPASEVSDDDVRSDEEESDEGGGGPDVDTTPSTPAVPSTPNFEPENTPPPDQKSGGGRPQLAPQSRRVKETKSAEDERSDRLRGAVTERGEKRDEKYKSLRGIPETKRGEGGPPAGAEQSTDPPVSKKRSSEESAESAETLDLPSTRHVKFRKQETELKTELALAVVKANAAVESDAGAVEPVARGGDILLPPSTKEKNPAGSIEFKKTEQRRRLYKLASYWKPYKKNIQALVSRVRDLMKLTPIELKNKIEKMNDLIGVVCMYFHHCYHNPVYQKYLKDNFIEPALRYEFMVIELMSGAANTTDRDGTDEKLAYISLDDWKGLLIEFSDMTPSEQEKSLKALTSESELQTFPADVSPLIYNLTRRLEALQAW
jgi:hypothetical protein